MTVNIQVSEEPRYVQRAWSEMQPVWQEWSRTHGGGWTIKVGAAVRRADPRFVDGLVHDGYRLRIDPVQQQITVAGDTDRGTMYGLFRLTQWLASGADPVPMDGRRQPRLAQRGMYAHTAWIYAHPYALRSWDVVDWIGYVDWLARQEYNLLQLWVPVGIMAMPPDESDQAWLAMLQEVVRYAQQERGFQVWVGEAANNVITRRPSVHFREREYFAYYLGNLRDPADPETFAAIRRSRSVLYQTFAKADGFWIIDSDPGGWPGSPTADFVAILRLHAEMMQQWVHPRAQLIYWMWLGWGTADPERCWDEALYGLKQLGWNHWGCWPIRST